MENAPKHSTSMYLPKMNQKYYVFYFKFLLMTILYKIKNSSIFFGSSKTLIMFSNYTIFLSSDLREASRNGMQMFVHWKALEIEYVVDLQMESKLYAQHRAESTDGIEQPVCILLEQI